MKLWIDEAFGVSPPGFDLWVWTIADAIAVFREGVVEEVSLGGRLGLEVAMWIEDSAWRKTLGPVRWRIHGGAGLDPGNARASMMNAEVYWGIRVIDYTSQIRER